MPKPDLKSLFMVLAVGASCIFSNPANGREAIAISKKVGTVQIVRQDVSELIREIASREGFEVSISRKVRGVVENVRVPLDIDAMLKLFAKDFDLEWYFQQKKLFVSTDKESGTRLIYLGKMTLEELQDAMADAQIADSGFDQTLVDESNSVLINAPVSFIASVELLIEAYNKTAKNRRSSVRVIRFGRIGN